MKFNPFYAEVRKQEARARQLTVQRKGLTQPTSINYRQLQQGVARIVVLSSSVAQVLPLRQKVTASVSFKANKVVGVAGDPSHT